MKITQSNRDILREIIRNNVTKIGEDWVIEFTKLFSSPGSLHCFGILGMYEMIAGGWHPKHIVSLNPEATPLCTAIADHHRKCSQGLRISSLEDFEDDTRAAKSSTVVIISNMLDDPAGTLSAIANIRWRVAKVLGILVAIESVIENREKIETAGYPVISLYSMKEIRGT